MTTRVDLEGSILSENSQTEQTLYDSTCMWNPNTQANEQTERRYRKQSGGCQEGVGLGVGELGEGGKRYKLPAVKRASREDVTYSMPTIVNNTVLQI